MVPGLIKIIHKPLSLTKKPHKAIQSYLPKVKAFDEDYKLLTKEDCLYIRGWVGDYLLRSRARVSVCVKLDCRFALRAFKNLTISAVWCASMLSNESRFQSSIASMLQYGGRPYLRDLG